MPAEGDDAAFARVAVELELPERQAAYAREERGFIIRLVKLGLVSEALREFGCRSAYAAEDT